jgi:hypothetical protein
MESFFLTPKTLCNDYSINILQPTISHEYVLLLPCAEGLYYTWL